MKNNEFRISLIIFLLVIGCVNSFSQTCSRDLPFFNKVKISPYINLELEKGDEHIEMTAKGIDVNEVVFKVRNSTLFIYLEDARNWPKDVKIWKEDHKCYVEQYRGAQVNVKLSYQQLKSLLIKGEQTVTFNDDLVSESFKLKSYGEADIQFSKVDIKDCKIKLIGENNLDVSSGIIKNCKATLIGGNDLNLDKVNTQYQYCTSIGEDNINVKSKDKLKVTLIGETDVTQHGRAFIQKRIVLGDNDYNYALK